MRSPPRFRDERFEVPIEAEGRVPLPLDLVRKLELEPGDIIGLKPCPDWEDGDWLQLRFYRQVLTFPWEAIDPRIRWSFARELLSLPLTALEEGGAIWVPPDVLTLATGDLAALHIEGTHLSWPLVDLRRVDPPAPHLR